MHAQAQTHTPNMDEAWHQSVQGELTHRKYHSGFIHTWVHVHVGAHRDSLILCQGQSVWASVKAELSDPPPPPNYLFSFYHSTLPPFSPTLSRLHTHTPIHTPIHFEKHILKNTCPHTRRSFHIGLVPSTMHGLNQKGYSISATLSFVPVVSPRHFNLYTATTCQLPVCSRQKFALAQLPRLQFGSHKFTSCVFVFICVWISTCTCVCMFIHTQG